MGLLQSVERVRNRLPLVDHAVLTACVARGVAGAMTQPSLVRVLVSVLRLSVGEATRRVRAAGALASRTSVTGEPVGPRRPVLAAAQRSGGVTPEQVHVD